MNQPGKFDWSGLIGVAIGICLGLVIGFAVGRESASKELGLRRIEVAMTQLKSESLAKDLAQTKLELTAERMLNDALQKHLDVMRADELYRQRAASNVLLQIDDIFRKVKP